MLDASRSDDVPRSDWEAAKRTLPVVGLQSRADRLAAAAKAARERRTGAVRRERFVAGLRIVGSKQVADVLAATKPLDVPN